jgi:hypothetical protein
VPGPNFHNFNFSEQHTELPSKGALSALFDVLLRGRVLYSGSAFLVFFLRVLRKCLNSAGFVPKRARVVISVVQKLRVTFVVLRVPLKFHGIREKFPKYFVEGIAGFWSVEWGLTASVGGPLSNQTGLIFFPAP